MDSDNVKVPSRNASLEELRKAIQQVKEVLKLLEARIEELEP